MVASSYASHTALAHCRSFLYVGGLHIAAATSLFVEPPIVVNRCWSGPAIRKKAPIYPPAAWVSMEVRPAPHAPTGKVCVEFSVVGDCWMVEKVAAIASSLSLAKSWAKAGGTALSTCPNFEILQV